MKFLFTVLAAIVLQLHGFAQSLPSLTAVYDNTQDAVKVRWLHNDAGITGYIVQRSGDGRFFDDVLSVKTAGVNEGTVLKYTDNRPSEKKYYYRLKIFRGGSAYEATLPIMVIPGDASNSWVIYPVPVQSVLHLQYTGSGNINGVITILVQSASSGRTFVRLREASTARNIDVPVDNLGNGIYDIRIFIGNDPVWNQRFSK